MKEPSPEPSLIPNPERLTSCLPIQINSSDLDADSCQWFLVKLSPFGLFPISNLDYLKILEALSLASPVYVDGSDVAKHLGFIGLMRDRNFVTDIG